jgi:hypothetical protein
VDAQVFGEGDPSRGVGGQVETTCGGVDGAGSGAFVCVEDGQKCRVGVVLGDPPDLARSRGHASPSATE